MNSNTTTMFIDSTPKIVYVRWYSPRKEKTTVYKQNYTSLFKKILQESIDEIINLRQELRNKYPEVYAHKLSTK